MNCGEIRNLAPLYLSGEISEEQRQSFAHHLAACPACEAEIERQSTLDARLLAAFCEESPDTSRIEQSLLRHIASAQSRKRWMGAGAIAAGVIAALMGSYALLRPSPAPRSYADAARDHWAEVVEKQPRHWRSGPAEIETLAAQSGLSVVQVEALAPAGYWLEHAKTCGLDGQRMLHLVFTNGTQEYSLYVRPHQSTKERVRIVRSNSEQVAGFETGHFTAFVVTVGPAAQCEELAQLTATRL